MAWLHTWSGLVVGWILFAVFLTGTASYFRQEISQWMRPELRPATVTMAQAADRAIDVLRREAPEATLWRIDLPGERDPVLKILWRAPTHQGFRSLALDPASGTPIEARQTMGGDLLYYFHFDLLMPGAIGRWIVCICATIMLVGLVSGVITHRRIFADFFTFRPGKGQRSWLDAHNATGVLALPYHLMITYSGLITLLPLYLPFGITTAYQGDLRAFNIELAGDPTPGPRSGQSAPLAPIAPLLTQAEALWEGGRAGRILVLNPHDANAVTVVQRRDADRISYAPQSVDFEATSGRLLSRVEPEGAALHARGVLYGLHLGRFADWGLRALFFLSGLAGSAMVATGLILWAHKRRPPAGTRHLGHRVVEVLNLATIAGLPLAIAGLFWANRLLPLDLPGRAVIEARCFLAVWLVTLALAALRAPARAWRDLLLAGATAFAALPLVNAATSSRHLGHSLVDGDGVMAGFDLSMLAIALLLALVARMAARRGA